MEIKINFNKEIDKLSKKAYLDEVLYIMAYSKRVKSNPNKKVVGITRFFTRIEAILIFYLIILLILIKTANIITYFDLILLGAVSLIIGIFFRYYISYKKMLNKLLEEDNKYQFLKINKESVEYKDNDKVLGFKLDAIDVIVINKYSVSIISNTTIPVIISCPIAYKEEVLKGLNDAGLSKLIVDNQEKYK